MQPLVDAWRAANPNIVAFWSALDRAARTVIRKKTSVRVGKVTLYWQDDKMFMRLPSGRNLCYFKKRKLSEITARDVIDWQNEIRQHTKSSGESYSPDYLKNVHTQLSCIFNHAIKYYGLQINPAAKAGNMGSEQPKEMLFWTKEEYLKFIDAMIDKPMLYYAFEILYWCGICPLPKVTLEMMTADLIWSLAMALNRRPRKITSSRKPTQSMHAMRQAVSAGE